MRQLHKAMIAPVLLSIPLAAPAYAITDGDADQYASCIAAAQRFDEEERSGGPPSLFQRHEVRELVEAVWTLAGVSDEPDSSERTALQRSTDILAIRARSTKQRAELDRRISAGLTTLDRELVECSRDVRQELVDLVGDLLRRNYLVWKGLEPDPRN